MSGVMDEHGQQWEHCSLCREFVKIQDLEYEEASEAFPFGLDLCPSCYNKRHSVANKDAYYLHGIIIG
jgi:hypothetical protein